MTQSPQGLSADDRPELVPGGAQVDTSWPLRCPVHDVAEEPPPMSVLRRTSDGRATGLACPTGHRFDAAKQGYVNLLVGRGSSSTPDSSAMIMARERVQDAGVFDALSDALRGLTEHWAPPARARTSGEITDERSHGADSTGLVLDCGAGTGHHLRGLLDARPGSRGVALDLSPAGLRRAARHPGTLALAWDLWRPLPLHDGSVDLLLDVFAPRNVTEYARVLSADGRAVVVTPRPGHLVELADLGLLRMQQDKLSEVTDQLARGLDGPVEHRSVTSTVPVPEDIVVDLVMMGPAGHHREVDEVAEQVARAAVTAVTVDLDLTVWRPTRVRV